MRSIPVVSSGYSTNEIKVLYGALKKNSEVHASNSDGDGEAQKMMPFAQRTTAQLERGA
jgi:hypothetical protein